MACWATKRITTSYRATGLFPPRKSGQLKSTSTWSRSCFAKRGAVSVLFKHGGLNPRFNEDHVVFYGSEGAIYIKGHYGGGPLYLYGEDKEWRKVALPAEIAADVPDIKDDTERNWCYLVRELVRDISGETVAPYQTFKEGSRYQQLIDIIRRNGNWVDVCHLR